MNVVLIVCTRSFTAWNASLVVCLHGCAIGRGLKQTFAECKIFLEGKLVRVANRPHFEAQTQQLEAEITSPNSDRAQHLFLKPDLGPKVKFNKRVKTRATAGYWSSNKVNITK